MLNSLKIKIFSFSELIVVIITLIFFTIFVVSQFTKLVRYIDKKSLKDEMEGQSN